MTQGRTPRIQWASDVNLTTSLNAWKQPIKASLRAIYASIGPLGAYNMQGAQAAQTVVQTNTGATQFATKDNVHSEMVALDYMLNTGQWILNFGQAQSQNALVPANAFTTTQPHCGFCTIMLATTQLPLTQPTHGNYNLAVNSNYPIPPLVQKDQFVLIKLINNRVYERTVLKQFLNVFFSFPPTSWVLQIAQDSLVDDNGEVAPQNVGNRALITLDEIRTRSGDFVALWRFIWGCLYEVNNE